MIVVIFMPFNVDFVTVAAFDKSLGGYYSTTNMLEETEVMGLIWHIANGGGDYLEFRGDNGIGSIPVLYFKDDSRMSVEKCYIPSQEMQDLIIRMQDSTDEIDKANFSAQVKEILKSEKLFDYDSEQEQYDEWISNINNAKDIEALREAFMNNTTDSTLEGILVDIEGGLGERKAGLEKRLRESSYNYQIRYNDLLNSLSAGKVQFKGETINTSSYRGIEYILSIIDTATSIGQIEQYFDSPWITRNFPGVKNAFDEVKKQCVNNHNLIKKKFGSELDFIKSQLVVGLRGFAKLSAVSRDIPYDYEGIAQDDLLYNVHSYKTLVQNLDVYGYHTVFFTEGAHWTAAAFLKTDDGVKVFTFNSFGNFKEGPYTQNAGDIDIICNKLNQEQGIENVHKPEDCSIPIQFANNCGVCVGVFCGTFLKMAADEKEINAQTLKQEVANNFYGRDVENVTECSWNEKRVANNRVVAEMDKDFNLNYEQLADLNAAVAGSSKFPITKLMAWLSSKHYSCMHSSENYKSMACFIQEKYPTIIVCGALVFASVYFRENISEILKSDVFQDLTNML